MCQRVTLTILFSVGYCILLQPIIPVLLSAYKKKGKIKEKLKEEVPAER
jgi:hypothetical protein